MSRRLRRPRRPAVGAQGRSGATQAARGQRRPAETRDAVDGAIRAGLGLVYTVVADLLALCAMAENPTARPEPGGGRKRGR